ncbi:Hypothetical predicted protein [Cloeon dipterum]|uniref:histone acetyltransferase n=1 Tax=Cloeon dipterum TaxID=197152 RepID=A0A8S1CY04_9INSE|nr:Hypothetical predicted protein [Cloeon dipterum]
MSAPKIPRLEESQSPNYSNEEVTMQIRQQLFSLLHAQNCHQQECPYSACWKVKSLVNHMIMCAEGKSCQTSLCTSSKHILKHWHECTQRDYCPVCSHLRKDNSEAEAQKPNAPTSVLKEVDSSLALRAAAVRQDNSRAIISTNVITIPHPKQPMTDESLNSLYDCQFWEFHQEAKDYAAVELHRFWHHCFEVNHTITRRIYSQSTIEERIAIRNSCNEFCMIQILSKKGLLDLILGPESDGITIYRVNQQLAFTLIGYLSYCQRAETVQQMVTKT